MVDVFQFSNIYACTAEVAMLVEDEAMQLECAHYVYSAGKFVPCRKFSYFTNLTKGRLVQALTDALPRAL
jgi:hypothetical protein